MMWNRVGSHHCSPYFIRGC